MGGWKGGRVAGGKVEVREGGRQEIRVERRQAGRVKGVEGEKGLGGES